MNVGDLLVVKKKRKFWKDGWIDVVVVLNDTHVLNSSTSSLALADFYEKHKNHKIYKRRLYQKIYNREELDDHFYNALKGLLCGYEYGKTELANSVYNKIFHSSLQFQTVDDYSKDIIIQLIHSVYLGPMMEV